MRLLIVLISLLMSVPISAIAEGLDCQGKYTMLEVADCNFYQGEGTDKIWDLTNLNLTGAKTEYELKSPGNDTLALKDTDTSYFYTFKGDTLLYLGFENRLLKVANNVGIPIAYKPLQYSNSLSGDFNLEGEYCKTSSYIEAGEIFTSVDAVGSVVTPFDTIKNAVQLTQIRKTVSQIADSVSIGLLESSKDTLITVLQTKRSLFAPGFNYPLVEYGECKFYCNDTLVGKSKDAFVNELAYWGEVYEYQTKKNVNAVGEKTFSKSRMPTNDIYNLENNEIIHDFRIEEIEQSKGNIHISYSYTLKEDVCDFQLTACDLSGRVLYFQPKQDLTAGKYVEAIDLASGRAEGCLIIMRSGDKLLFKQLIR